MMRHLLRSTLLVAAVVCGSALRSQAQDTASGNAQPPGKLHFVIYLSRHGVRSPTGKNAQNNQYSATPWPEWSVQPGYLTAHGFQLMRLFGAYDRAKFASEGLLSPSGCDDAARLTILADSDQRTRETGKAIAEGMFPGCAPEVHARAEGVNDPLFHPLHSGVNSQERATAYAAIAGRIGGDPNRLTAAYGPQLEALEQLLAGCGAAATAKPLTSLFDVPARLEEGSGDHLATLRGPLNTASTLSENLLLEYTEGMKGPDLGWGCLDEAKLRHFLQLHTAAEDYADRTPAIARVLSANLLDVIGKSLEQSASGKVVPGAPGSPQDRMLFLVGHDTNIAAVAGALGLTWIIDGRRDDTPPGGALVFELWRWPATGDFSVKVYFTAQTLDQMRNSKALDLADPPAIAPLFIPGCSTADSSCSLAGFVGLLEHTAAASGAGPQAQPRP